MPSLKESAQSHRLLKATRKITKAMQMVAAASCARAQEAATAAPLRGAQDRVLANLNQRLPTKEVPRRFCGHGKDDTHLLVVMTAERGLCGGFNSSIVRLARADAHRRAPPARP